MKTPIAQLVSARVEMQSQGQYLHFLQTYDRNLGPGAHGEQRLWDMCLCEGAGDGSCGKEVSLETTRFASTPHRLTQSPGLSPRPTAVPSGPQMWPIPNPSCFLETSKARRGHWAFAMTMTM